MFGCCNSLSSEISRIAVEGTPSSSLSKRIFFKATVLFVFLFFPLYTTPYVPKTQEVMYLGLNNDNLNTDAT